MNAYANTRAFEARQNLLPLGLCGKLKAGQSTVRENALTKWGDTRFGYLKILNISPKNRMRSHYSWTNPLKGTSTDANESFHNNSPRLNPVVGSDVYSRICRQFLFPRIVPPL